jgi:tRNA U34 2-thiouridine synthase MnmA/TrmU
VAKGEAVVLYDADTVLGSATISGTSVATELIRS